MRAKKQHRSRAVTAVRAVLAAVVFVPLLLGSSPARAAGLQIDKDTFLDVHLLLQPTIQLRHGDPNDHPTLADINDYPSNIQRTYGDAYMRRTRFVLGGQVTKWVSFFAESDMPNWGKAGDWKTSTFYVQDAYMQFNIHEAFNIVGGMILTPFFHNASQGATSLHNLDYHADLVKYPAAANKVWRDNGVIFRGFLFNKHLDYRIAFSNGVQDGAEVIAAKAAVGTNPAVPAVIAATGECPRFSGRLQYNVFDAEEGFFLAGTYLGKKKLLSFGFAYDVQPGVYGPKNQYWGMAGDVFLDMPLGKNRVTGQIDVVGYGGDKNPTRGKGMLFDLGYAIGRWEPLIAVDWYRADVEKNANLAKFANDLLGLHAGLNWWFKGHTANVKLDVGMVKYPGVETKNSATVVTLQTQLYL